MDPRSASGQAGRQDAAECHVRCRPQRAHYVSGESQVSATMSSPVGRSELADLTTRADDAADRAELAELARTYAPRRGLWGWITAVDHKSIGKRYIWTAIGFFVLAGVNAG